MSVLTGTPAVKIDRWFYISTAVVPVFLFFLSYLTEGNSGVLYNHFDKNVVIFVQRIVKSHVRLITACP